MIRHWTAWKSFPDARRGEPIEAPTGPGLYEVRVAATGEVLAFGHSGNVVRALAALGPRSFWQRVLRSGLIANRNFAFGAVEYRTWATASKREAREIEASFNRRRRVFWQRIALSH